MVIYAGKFSVPAAGIKNMFTDWFVPVEKNVLPLPVLEDGT